MIKSMTGFGRGEYQEGSYRFTVEMKSVNHRYFDAGIKLPRKLNFCESAVRTVLKDYIRRGKVDVFVTCEDLTAADASVKYNGKIAEEYAAYFRQMSENLGLVNDLTASVLGQLPEVFSMEEKPADEDVLWAVLEKSLKIACRQLIEAREREGSALFQDLMDKLDGMGREVQAIEERSPQIMEAYREKIGAKLREILADPQIEESRIASEVILYADKVCTDEETVRLKSHIETAKAVLEEGGAVGRKLDFLAQEMNREANTILSKANDLATSNLAINLKTEIEKLREQIQNIE